MASKSDKDKSDAKTAGDKAGEAAAAGPLTLDEIREKAANMESTGDLQGAVVALIDHIKYYDEQQ